MAKKRKTLPKNFQELIDAKDIPALKAVFDVCEIDAYDGANRETALHYYNVPDEFARWVVAQGLDINVRDHYERTPLHRQAIVGSDSVNVLLELGADVHAKDKYDSDTPLHMAAEHHEATVRTLIAHGADVNAKNNAGITPLSYALAHGANIDIHNLAAIADVLLNAGAEITTDMPQSVERIGKYFEFYRADFHKDCIAETEAGLAHLYELFHVEPVAKRQTYDGKAPIVVPYGNWGKQHDALWQLLVPGQGQAKTVQGEVIRLTGKLAWEIMDNGGCNWDVNFRKMLAALPEYFGKGNPLPSDELKDSKHLAKQLRGGSGGGGSSRNRGGSGGGGGSGGNEPERLMELAVHWVQANHNPIALGKTKYKR